MKFLLLIMILSLMSCGTKSLFTPYGTVKIDPQSQLFVYSDIDVKAPNNAKTDDTLLIVIGLKDRDADEVKSIFNNAMEKITKIYEDRQKVYKEWLKIPTLVYPKVCP